MSYNQCKAKRGDTRENERESDELYERVSSGMRGCEISKLSIVGLVT